MYYLILAGIVLLDQFTKLLVNSLMYVGESIPVINNVFHITYIHNTGAAFSFMAGHTMFLAGLTAGVLLALLVYMIHGYKRHQRVLNLTLAFIIAGGVGNLIDRMVRGYVVDMFDFRIWPVFNIADIAICIGCMLLVIYVLFLEPKGKHRR